MGKGASVEILRQNIFAYEKIKPSAQRVVHCLYCGFPMRDLDEELRNHISRCPTRNQIPEILEIKETNWVY